jgi:hypothetical protein
MAETTTASLTGLYKQVYGDLKVLLPDSAQIQKEIGALTEAEKVGDFYHQPVVLTREMGFTVAGSSGTAYALNGAVSMTMADAQIEGAEVTLESQVALRVATKSASSTKAFKQGVGLVIQNNLSSHANLREIQFIVGRSPFGLGQSASMANDSGTQTTVTLSAATWATGIWSGMENVKVNAYRTDTGALLGGATTGNADSIGTVAVVDIDNTKVTITGTATFTTAIQAQAANTTLILLGARGTTLTNNYYEPAGIDYVLNAASGTTIFNISNANSLWKPNTFSASSGAFTFLKCISALNKPIAKAGLDEDVNGWVSIATFPSLVDSFAAARMLDDSYDENEGKNGVKRIKYVYGPSVITIRPHTMVYGSRAYLLPKSVLTKIGSADIGMTIPGRNEELFWNTPGFNSVSFRTYSDLAPFIKEPAKTVAVTTIVNP